MSVISRSKASLFFVGLVIWLNACGATPENAAIEVLEVRIVARTPDAVESVDPSFYNIRTARMIGDNDFLVLDQGDMTVKRTDLEGRISQTWAGKGDGPGEVRLFAAVGLGNAKDFYIVDTNLHRVTRFSLNSTDIDTRTIQDRFFNRSFPCTILPDGTVLWYTREVIEDTAHPTGFTSRYTFIEVPWDQIGGRVLKVIVDGYRNQPVSSGRTVSSPFSPNPAGLYSESKLYWTFSSDYDISVFAEDRSEHILSVDIVPVQVTNHDLEEVYTPQTYQRYKGKILTPKTRSFIRDLSAVDDKGRLWVLRYPHSIMADPPEGSESHYDLVDLETSRIVAQVRIPYGLVFAVRGTTAFAYSNSLSNQGTLIAYQIEDKHP